jgi:hypothetical protein
MRAPVVSTARAVDGLPRSTPSPPSPPTHSPTTAPPAKKAKKPKRRRGGFADLWAQAQQHLASFGLPFTTSAAVAIVQQLQAGVPVTRPGVAPAPAPAPAPQPPRQPQQQQQQQQQQEVVEISSDDEL